MTTMHHSAAFALAALAATSVSAGVETYTAPAADLISYTYPFASQIPRTEVPVFGAQNNPGFVGTFDERDWQQQWAWNTAGMGITPDLGHVNYVVERVELAWSLATPVGTVAYDPTLDSHLTYDLVDRPAVTPDTDPGRPITLFGAGFRNGFTGFTFDPADPNGPPLFSDSGEGYGPGTNGKDIRHVFPIDFDDLGLPRSVSNNLDESGLGDAGFDPNPFAIATTDAVLPGQALTLNTIMSFDIAVEDPHIQGYLARALDQGILGFVLATLHPATGSEFGQRTGTYPRFFQRDFGPQVVGAIEIDVLLCTEGCADIDGNTVVDATDFFTVIQQFGLSGPDRTADIDGNDVVDATDFFTVIQQFGLRCCTFIPADAPVAEGLAE